MSSESFQALTPYINLLLVLGVGIIGWFLRWMVAQNLRHLTEIRTEILKIENDVKELERHRQTDLKYMYEHYVNKEAFYVAVGKTEGLISRIFDQLNELSRSVNRVIGVIDVREKNNE
ncbi:MAG: hypothetical protein COV67_08975 [Nitrospinae bacterium CG11_big_fil_rev_8_21_14_0_20_56_8]|nr:MAG: hypothetical protein COV67_08975 [Nitrospinae bacterium CG11_big_fil_rev_8_21_14_0_20_56_8]